MQHSLAVPAPRLDGTGIEKARRRGTSRLVRTAFRRIAAGSPSPKAARTRAANPESCDCPQEDEFHCASCGLQLLALDTVLNSSANVVRQFRVAIRCTL